MWWVTVLGWLAACLPASGNRRARRKSMRGLSRFEAHLVDGVPLSVHPRFDEALVALLPPVDWGQGVWAIYLEMREHLSPEQRRAAARCAIGMLRRARAAWRGSVVTQAHSLADALYADMPKTCLSSDEAILTKPLSYEAPGLDPGPPSVGKSLTWEIPDKSLRDFPGTFEERNRLWRGRRCWGCAAEERQPALRASSAASPSLARRAREFGEPPMQSPAVPPAGRPRGAPSRRGTWRRSRGARA